MNSIGRWWACAAAITGLAGCSDPAPDQAAAPSGGSVTINLPEPDSPAVEPATANMADANVRSILSESVDTGPANKAGAPAEKPAREEAKPAPKPEPSEGAESLARTERKKNPQPPAESASLPLANAVIVRTIEKIGYPCGSIVSSSKIEGASGSSDYRINCSSGASYRASNRTGRYRFSKVD